MVDKEKQKDLFSLQKSKFIPAFRAYRSAGLVDGQSLEPLDVGRQGSSCSKESAKELMDILGQGKRLKIRRSFKGTELSQPKEVSVPQVKNSSQPRDAIERPVVQAEDSSNRPTWYRVVSEHHGGIDDSCVKRQVQRYLNLQSM